MERTVCDLCDVDDDNSFSLCIDPRECAKAYQRWLWLCSFCACSNDVGSRYFYQIEEERISTVSEALEWTLHLAQKNWFLNTNWQETLYRIFKFPKDKQ